MNLQDELKRINEFFENISSKEFDDMLVRNGIENDKYNIDSDITFSYKKCDEYKKIINKIKKQQDNYYKNNNTSESSINSYNNINLEAA